MPFEGDTPLSVAFKHKNEIPIAPRKLNSQVPEPLNKVILRCLEKDKADRYQTAEELLSDLALVEEGLPITERVATKTRTTLQRSALSPAALAPLSRPRPGRARRRRRRLRPLARPAARKSCRARVSSGRPSIAVLNFENLSRRSDPRCLERRPAQASEHRIVDSKLIRVVDGQPSTGS